MLYVKIICDKKDFLSTCEQQGLVWTATMESNAVIEP